MYKDSAKKTAPSGAVYRQDCEFVSGWVTNRIVNVNRVRGFHDQTIANAVIGFENHDGTGLFVRQRNLAAANTVFYDSAGLKNREHVTDR